MTYTKLQSNYISYKICFRYSDCNKKEPSPFMKPVNQWGFIIFENWIEGLGTGIQLGKAYFKVLDKPLFILAFILTIYVNLIKLNIL